MKYNLITPATTLPVSVVEAKLHLRITHSSHDSLITDLIWAAVREFENRTNECLKAQTWDLVLDPLEVAGVIRFHKFPVLGITSITYFDSDNTSQSLTSSNDDYMSFINGRPASILFDDPPSVYNRDGAMTIRFLAGYSTLPYDIKQALLARIFRIYENPNDPVSERVSYFDKIANSYRSFDL